MIKISEWFKVNLSFKAKRRIGGAAIVILILFFCFYEFAGEKTSVEQFPSNKQVETSKKDKSYVNDSLVKLDVKPVKMVSESHETAKKQFKPIKMPDLKKLATKASKNFKRPKLIREHVNQLSKLSKQKVYADDDIAKPDKDINY